MKYYKLPSQVSSDVSLLSYIFGSGGFVSPKILISHLYGTGTYAKNYTDLFFSEPTLEKLFKEAEIVEISELKKSLNKKETDKSNVNDDDFFNGDVMISEDSTYLFFYKDNFLKISISDEEDFKSNKKEKCSISFYFPFNKKCVDEEFTHLIVNSTEPKVFLLTHQYGEYTFQKFSLSLPKTFDLDLNYGKGFEDINKKITESLNKNHSGLYMFHGPPGTGKSTYIKYLASSLQKDVIFFPTSLVGSIVNPEIVSLLIQKQNCILILEDAEKAIVKREADADASLVSTLLNMTDGILGDVLKLNVIVTYNCKRTEIDEALLRRGRLKAEHSFNPLPIDAVKKLSKKLKLNIEPEGEMTLADIFNYKKDLDLIGNKDALVDKKRIIGFSS